MKILKFRSSVNDHLLIFGNTAIILNRNAIVEINARLRTKPKFCFIPTPITTRTTNPNQTV